MTDYRNYIYHSALSPYMEELVSEKRKLGYIYNVQAYNLKRLDDYWLAHGYDDAVITAERVNDWICCLPGEGRSSQQGRVSTLRALAFYMNMIGIQAYVPFIRIGNDHPVIHILSDDEIHELFLLIDGYSPGTPSAVFQRMADEYPVIFRLYYCCGMRNNEVCSLKTSDADLQNGILTIRDGKNHKDRLVYLPEDLRILAEKYFWHLKKTLGFEPFWFFPGKNPANHISKTQIDKKFDAFWNTTQASKICDKKPTPHCLRHTFVVNRINQWILEGTDVNVMLPYLSKYLGHRDPNESFYYYHTVSDAFRIIQQKDTVAASVIPEVRRR